MGSLQCSLHFDWRICSAAISLDQRQGCLQIGISIVEHPRFELVRSRVQGGDLLDWTSDKGIQMDAFIQRIDALSTMGCAFRDVIRHPSLHWPPILGHPPSVAVCQWGRLTNSQTYPLTLCRPVHGSCKNVADQGFLLGRYTVLLSNFRRYFKLASYISTHTTESIVIAMGVPSLRVSATKLLGLIGDLLPPPVCATTMLASFFAPSRFCSWDACTPNAYSCAVLKPQILNPAGAVLADLDGENPSDMLQSRYLQLSCPELLIF